MTSHVPTTDHRPPTTPSNGSTSGQLHQGWGAWQRLTEKKISCFHHATPNTPLHRSQSPLSPHFLPSPPFALIYSRLFEHCRIYICLLSFPPHSRNVRPLLPQLPRYLRFRRDWLSSSLQDVLLSEKLETRQPSASRVPLVFFFASVLIPRPRRHLAKPEQYVVFSRSAWRQATS